MPAAWKFPVVITGLEGAPYLMTCWVNHDNFNTAVLARGRVNDFCARLAELMDNALTMNLPTEVSLWSAPNTLTSVHTVVGAAIPGTQTGATAPRATQGLLRLRTESFNGNKRVQGRLFIPGVTTLGIDAATGKPNTDYLADLNFAAEIPTAGGFVVGSRVLNTFHAVSVASADSEFAVLRSRRD